MPESALDRKRAARRPRRRAWAAALLALVVLAAGGLRPLASKAWAASSSSCSSSASASEGRRPAPPTGTGRREAASAVLAGAAALPLPAALLQQPPAAWAEAQRLDEYGRPVMADGSLGVSEGISYDGVAKFNGKPKVFLAGSTGELGRRVALDLLRSGYSVYLGIRDEGRAAECQYQDRKSAKYEMTVVKDALIETGREQALEEQLRDASVVIHVAGARFGVDILRLGVGLDPKEPERTDLNGTKALIDAAKAKGVKKFIYVSAVLTNARALGEEGSDGFKSWNQWGGVLDCKHEAEEYLKRSGLDYTILRPAPMTNDFPRDVGGLAFLPPDTIRLQGGEVGNKVSRDDVSLACFDAVFNPKASNVVAELVGVSKRPPTDRARWWELKDQTAAAPVTA